MIDPVGTVGDQGWLISASWLLVALGVGLLLVWSLRRFGRSSGSRRPDAAAVTGGLVALALGLAGVSFAAARAVPFLGNTRPAAAQPASAPLPQTDAQVRQFQLTVGRTQWVLARVLLGVGSYRDATPMLRGVRETFSKLHMIEEAGLAGLDLVEALIASEARSDAVLLVQAILSEFQRADLNTRAITALSYLRDLLPKLAPKEIVYNPPNQRSPGKPGTLLMWEAFVIGRTRETLPSSSLGDLRIPKWSKSIKPRIVAKHNQNILDAIRAVRCGFATCHLPSGGRLPTGNVVPIAALALATSGLGRPMPRIFDQCMIIEPWTPTGRVLWIGGLGGLTR